MYALVSGPLLPGMIGYLHISCQRSCVNSIQGYMISCSIIKRFNLPYLIIVNTKLSDCNFLAQVFALEFVWKLLLCFRSHNAH